jgi:hypothetical protein
MRGHVAHMLEMSNAIPEIKRLLGDLGVDGRINRDRL